jgi:hypothetical protein
MREPRIVRIIEPAEALAKLDDLLKLAGPCPPRVKLTMRERIASGRVTVGEDERGMWRLWDHGTSRD